RLLRGHPLMAAQAERTIQDHWYRYYLTAAKKYAGGARELKISKPPEENKELYDRRLQEVGALDKRLQKETFLTTVPLSRPTWTDEQQKLLEWSIQADPGVPSGTPIIWHHVASEQNQKRLEATGK